MNDSDFKVVFNVMDSGYKSWWFPTLGLIGCIVVPFFLHIINSLKFPLDKRKNRKVFIFLSVGFLAFWTLFAFLSTFGDYQSARQTLASGKAGYVEGIVENFVPMPVSGHAMESFSVNGVSFRYSDYVIVAGFNNTSCHGGPIREGLPVRIWYKGNEILKLEIKGT